MDKLLELFRFKKIRGKLFILTTLITLLPMLFISLSVSQISADRLMKNAEKHTLAASGIANHYLTRILVDFNELFNVIISSSQIQCTLTGAKDQVCQNIQVANEESDYSYIRNSYRINNTMNTITQSKSYVVRYVIYHMTAPPEWRLYGSYISTAEAKEWYEELGEGNLPVIRDGQSLDQNMKKNEETMLVGRVLRRTSGDFAPLGFIILEVDKTSFFEGLSFLNADQQARLMIADKEGDMLHALPEREEEQETNESLFEMTWQLDPKAGQFVSIQDKWMSSMQHNLPFDWSLVYSIESDSLSEDARSIRAITVWIFAGTLVMGLLLANWISGTIRKPLNRLSMLIKVSGMIDPPPAIKFDPEDEVGQIGQRFIRMIHENKALDQQVYNALIKGKEAEIQALQAQINPHFLYNTLESLKWLAFSEKQFEISDVISNLGKYFRLTINKGNQIITVKKEVEHVMAYIQVQNFRYKDRFDFSLAFEEDLSGYYVPKFILQPIVENAIYHGLKQQEGQGMIIISGEVQDNILSFHITDDGKGITPDRIKELTYALDTEETSLTYGLKNVHDRLKLRYGDGFGVRIQSEFGLYTTITLAMPAITESEVAENGPDDESVDR
ncbi:sensor histidine kinase [Paenibacillus sp. LHD-38]|uniref:sensor histidine kinase n=1 Tax=Paenibacillus sp. LHD-38 TaxID=3072143 RepID=UPI00280DE798|nr:sensor histidine kinase [Paenibacillus sp. LHD-38]MDQ8736349.1 sensor histidine kinase [Paenibacillus sp. LHD-38]